MAEPRLRKVSHKTADGLKDEVYRQMLRLETGRPGAPVFLGVALVNAWMALEEQPLDCEPRRWLRRLSPLCLRMIADSCRAGSCSCLGADSRQDQAAPKSGN